MHEGNRAVRSGKWKLVAKWKEPWELYDMDADRTEMHNLAPKRPDLVKELAAVHDQLGHPHQRGFLAGAGVQQLGRPPQPSAARRSRNR